MQRNPYAGPVIVDGTTIARSEPVSWDEKTTEWICELLDRDPSLLPIAAVDDRLQGPLLPLGRTVQTSAGCIGGLAISRNGYPVLIETVTWSNRLAQRQAVTQILELGVQLRRWRYEQLDELANKRAGKGLWSYVAPGGVAEPQWTDLVTRNLRKGRVCLLLVGDGVREQTQDLLELLHGHGDFEFRLGMILLQVHQLPGRGRLVVPLVAARTCEIVRPVHLTAEVAAEPAPGVAAPAVGGPDSAASSLSESSFLDNISTLLGRGHALAARRLLRAMEAPLSVRWGTNSYNIELPDPAGSGRNIVLLRVLGSSESYFYQPDVRAVLAALWNDGPAADRVVQRMASLCDQFSARKTAKHRYLDLVKLRGREEEFVEGLLDVADLVKARALRQTR